MATCLPLFVIAILGTILVMPVDGEHTHHKKIVIHVPEKININHHTRTIYKHIYHKAKKEHKEVEHKKVEHKKVEHKEEKHKEEEHHEHHGYKEHQDHGHHEEHHDHGYHEHKDHHGHGHHEVHHDHGHHEHHHQVHEHHEHHDHGHHDHGYHDGESYEEIGYTYGKPYIPFTWEEEKKEKPKKYSHHVISHTTHHGFKEKKDPKLFSTYVSDFTNKFYEELLPHQITSYGNSGFKGHSESGLAAYH